MTDPAPSNGLPIPMSQFTLGERYSSEDMYRDMGIAPGDRVSFQKDGVIYTDTVGSITYTSSTPAVYRTLSRRQRILRRLTPRRFRKTLLIRSAQSPTVTVSTENALTDKTAATLARGYRAITELDEEPK
jgi:hypothetical protein